MITHDHPDQGVTTSNMETDLVENITKPEENSCKSFGSICSTCNVPNHFSTMCWSGDMSQQHPNTREGRPTQQGHDSRVNTSPLMHSSDWMYNGLTKKARPKICVGEARKCDRICNKRHDPTTFGAAQSEMTRSSHDMLLESEETHDLGLNCLVQ